MIRTVPVLMSTFCLLFAAIAAMPTSTLQSVAHSSRPGPSAFVGAVYTVTNGDEGNEVLAYARRTNGSISFIGNFQTGGKGAALDDGDGIGPLVSANSIILTPNNKFLLVVNAGSASVSSFRVLSNFRLRLVSVQRIVGFGPVSIAVYRNLVYVATADSDGKFANENDQRGNLNGLKLSATGKLTPIFRSVRQLPARPGAIQFSTNGRTLVVSMFNAGAAELETTKVDEIITFSVLSSGILSRAPVDTATSTAFGNDEGRNLPSAIGFEIVKAGDREFVVVTEARAFRPDGTVGQLQTSSVSTWSLGQDSMLKPVQLNTLVGTSVSKGQLATCWIEFSKSQDYYWVSNTATGTISALSFDKGISTLISEEAAEASETLDIWRSSDGRFLYQISNGLLGVFEIQGRGFGPGLTRIQSIENVPEMNAQGIVAF